MSKHVHVSSRTPVRAARWLSIAAVAGLTLGGCYKVNYKTGLQPGGATHSTKVAHFLWGAAGGGDKDVGSMCADGVASVHEQKSFVDQLISGLTGFLYSPTSVVVECAKGSGSVSASE